MRDAIVSAGLPELQIECIPGEVIVRFYPPSGLTHTVQPESLREKVLYLLRGSSLSKSMLAERLGQKQASGQLKKVIQDLIKEEIISYTIPEKPNSRLQKYRLKNND
jgi:hypothetical protein